MVTIRARSGAIGVCLLMLAAGCSREQQDWRSAETADTIESYDRFIQKHPESELATQARSRVAQLGEDRDWQHAGSADTVDAYREFLTAHPTGKWAQEARIRIENFSLGDQGAAAAGAAGQPAVAAVPATPSRPRAPVTATPGEAAVPATPPASTASVAKPPVAAPAAVSAGGFGIQLGAFSSEASATAQWKSLTSRFGPELAGLQEHVVVVDTGSGRVYRLQAVVGNEARARALCDSLRKRSQGCVAVLPH